MRNLIIATTIFASLALITEAQTRKPASGAKVEVVEATKQTTRFKVNNSTNDEYRFVLSWNDPTPPVTGFYYRSGNQWKETTLTRPERRQFSANPQDYMMVENSVQPKEIKPGDRIVITSHRHEHNEEEMPAAVKAMAKQGLFYATGNAKALSWKVIPVKIRVIPERLQ